MIFASPVFLFVFFPAVLLIYRLIPAKARPYFLLLSSLFFYFWGEPVYVLLMIAAILITWASALGISALKEKKKDKAALAVLTLGILLILPVNSVPISPCFPSSLPAPSSALQISPAISTVLRCRWKVHGMV